VRFTPVLLTVLILGAVSGCGGSPDETGDSADAPQPGGSASTESSSSTPSPPTVTPPGSKPAVPPPPGGEAPKTIRGTVTEGVEAGCLLLTANTESYVLIGGDRNVLQPGRTVEVTGVPDPGMVTTCQQGTPMKVTSARAV
jgi:hypothetical protein